MSMDGLKAEKLDDQWNRLQEKVNNNLPEQRGKYGKSKTTKNKKTTRILKRVGGKGCRELFERVEKKIE